MNIKRAKLVSEYRLAPKLAVPLQTISLLAAVVFVASFTHEVLDTNNLYVNQHFLLTILQLLLTLWAFIEVKSVASKITYTPLKSLETVLVVQFIVLLIRGFTGDGGFMEPSSTSTYIFHPKFEVALAFTPIYLILFSGIIYFIIKSFAYAEFIKKIQLGQEMISLKEAQSALVDSEERYRIITEWAHDVIWSLDTNGNFVFVSPSIETFTGIKPNELVHQSPSRILTKSSFHLLDLTLQTIARQVKLSNRFQQYCIELEYIPFSDKVITAEVNLNCLFDNFGVFTGFVAISRDITERKKMEIELRQAKEIAEASNLSLLAANAILHGHATTDQLTGVANRRYFENSLESQISHCQLLGSANSLIVIDIDNFKAINDCYGHQVGDMVLVESARLLQSTLRKRDLLARWGGDEFIILLSGSSGTEAFGLAQHLCDKFQVHRFPVVDRLTASFGVAEFQESERIEDWFSRSDEVLYAAKSAGRNCVKFSE